MPRWDRATIINENGRIYHKPIDLAKRLVRYGEAEEISSKPCTVRLIPKIKFNGGCIGGKVYFPKDCKKFLESIRHELEESLRRLKTDYIDLYQTHWQDPTTALADTIGELQRLKKEGKIRAIGASNVSG